MIDVQVLRATVASTIVRCFLDDCDAVLSGRPLGGWHLASLRWGTFLRTEPALRDLWCGRMGSDGNCSFSAV